MIRIEFTDVFGWESAIRGMRNPMNSWDKSDSYFANHTDVDGMKYKQLDVNDGVTTNWMTLGENDLTLMKKLVKAGSDHSKFMRMIHVACDITAPLYWWKEYDTYKVGTVANSCSTMHKIASKLIEFSDFSVDDFPLYGEDGLPFADVFMDIVLDCETLRKKYIETGDKRFWRALIQLLPCSYNQKRTVDLNYAVLRNMYHSRRNHKLDEWHTFCEWVEGLPYAKELICGE